MKTRKQIVEQTRNEVVKQYTANLQILMERINELQEKVNLYEDWIQRLQEFMEMPESQREEYIAHMKEQENANKIML